MNEIKYPPNTRLDISEFYNLVKGMKYDCETMSSDIPICSPKNRDLFDTMVRRKNA